MPVDLREEIISETTTVGPIPPSIHINPELIPRSPLTPPIGLATTAMATKTTVTSTGKRHHHVHRHGKTTVTEKHTTVPTRNGTHEVHEVDAKVGRRHRMKQRIDEFYTVPKDMMRLF